MEAIKYNYNLETGKNYCEIKFKIYSSHIIKPNDYHRLMEMLIEEIEKIEISNSNVTFKTN